MKKGFTLAEVLITIGIIGIVAAMTLPAIVTKYQEKVLVERLKQTYSIFSQAYLMAIQENGPAEFWDIDPAITLEGAEKLYDYFAPYLKLGEPCRGEYGCFVENYKTLSGGEYGYAPKNHTMYARGILANGVAFAMPSQGTGCKTTAEMYKDICGVLYVDLNGYKNPNQAGIDYFGFFITKKSILPIGLSGWQGGDNGYTCKYKGTSNGNGTGCTAWVLNKGNMDYLRRDISAEWD